MEYDRDATSAAYTHVLQAGADVCRCDSCENFARLRAKAYPEQFIAVLRSLGIDPLKEDEAYECSKDESGLYLYGGWLHFVGRVIRVGKEIEVGEFRFWFDQAGNVPSPHDAFKSGPVSAIEFLTHLPWVLERPEPDYSPPLNPPGFWHRVAETASSPVGATYRQQSCRARFMSFSPEGSPTAKPVRWSDSHDPALGVDLDGGAVRNQTPNLFNF